MASPEKTPSTKPNEKGSTPNIVKRPYISGGQVLESPPLQARLTQSFSSLTNILGLYLVTLFSLDPYTSAQNSSYNTTGPRPTGNSRMTGGRPLGNGDTGRSSGWGWGSGGGGSGGSGGAGPRRNIGTVDDVRSPECGSCG